MTETRRRGSLKFRLMFLSTTVILVVWCITAITTYYDARQEFGEMLDAHLAQSASLLAAHVSEGFDEVESESMPLLHRYSHKLAFQIWEKGKVLRLRSANAPEQPFSAFAQGYSDRVIDDVHWRIFSTWDEKERNLIQVAELYSDREELSHDLADNLLKPLLFSFPVLALLLWLAVNRSLEPLKQLGREVERREADNLAPLKNAAAPTEVLPLIEHLNTLFKRIDSVLQQERRFTADAAHELRTPIAAIKAQAQVAHAAHEASVRQHALNNAIVGCDRAAHLIDQLLTLARIDSMNSEQSRACSLRKIACEVIADTAPAALTHQIQLELLGGDECVVDGNAVLLSILLRNLIDNAIKHTRPGTSVRIDLRHEQDRCCLSVSDNGPGLPDTEMEKVLERFYRPLGTQSSGSGLGLSIVKRIAEIHAAELRLSRTTETSGLTVSLSFKQ